VIFTQVKACLGHQRKGRIHPLDILEEVCPYQHLDFTLGLHRLEVWLPNKYEVLNSNPVLPKIITNTYVP
jgi:hypothetical protein